MLSTPDITGTLKQINETADPSQQAHILQKMIDAALADAKIQEAAASSISRGQNNLYPEQQAAADTAQKNRRRHAPRHVVLPEFQPGLETDIIPPSSVLEMTNGTLKNVPCHLRIDEDGFMVSPKPVTPSDHKILLLGGSPIQNLYIPEDDRLSSRIETIFAGWGQEAKVYNAGLSYTHLLHMLNLLLNKGLALRPQCVVFYLAPVLDIMANELTNSFWHSSALMSPLRKPGQEKSQEIITRFANKGAFQDEKNLLHIMASVCKNFRIALVMTTWPLYGAYDSFMERYQPDQQRFEGEQQQTKILNALVRSVAQTKGCGLVDLEQIFGALNHHDYFYDLNHPNVKGCEVIAQKTSETIKSVLGISVVVPF